MPSPLINTTLGDYRRACVLTSEGIKLAPLHSLTEILEPLRFEIDHDQHSPTKGQLKFDESVVLPPSELVFVLAHDIQDEGSVLILEYTYHDGSHTATISPGRLVFTLSQPIEIVRNFEITPEADDVYRWLEKG